MKALTFIAAASFVWMSNLALAQGGVGGGGGGAGGGGAGSASGSSSGSSAPRTNSSAGSEGDGIDECLYLEWSARPSADSASQAARNAGAAGLYGRTTGDNNVAAPARNSAEQTKRNAGSAR